MSEYTDTILLECNRKSSPEYQSGNLSNPSTWTNKLGSGIKLNIGDKVLMKGAYVSAVGNEAATIEIRGRGAENNLVVGQEYSSSDTVRVKTMNTPTIGDTLYTYSPTTVTSQITDDKIALTHSYYKTTNGEFYITLPRACATDNLNVSYTDTVGNWTSYNSASNGSCASPNPFRLLTDYSEIDYFGLANGNPSEKTVKNAVGLGTGGITAKIQAQRTEIANDGSRHTLFVRNNLPNGSLNGEYSLHGHIDPALFTFNWYKRTYDYKIETGFNSPLNVAQSFTDQMSNIISTKVDRFTNASLASFSGNDNFNLVAESRTNEAMPCSFGSGFGLTNSHTYFKGRESHIKLLSDEQVPATIIGNGIIGAANNGSTGNAYRLGPNGSSSAELKAVFDKILYNMVIISPSRLAGYRVISKTEFKANDGSLLYYIVFDRNDLNIIQNNNEAIILSYWRTDEQQMYNYEACYATIGYKRPEIQETGRFTADGIGFQGSDRNLCTIDGGFKLETTAHYPMTSTLNKRQDVLHLAIEWTDENLLLLKKLFDAQGRYNELFDYDQMSASQQNGVDEVKFNKNKSNLRFIHMNASENGSFTGDCQNINPTLSGGSASYVAGRNYIQFSGHTLGKIRIGMAILPNGDFETDWLIKQGTRTYVTGIITILGSSEKVYLSENVKVTGSGNVLFTDAKVGGDVYFSNADVETKYIGSRTFPAGALYFDYNSSRSDVNDGDGTFENEFDTLRYGFGVKVLRSTSPLKYDIGLYFGRVGLEKTWFNGLDQILSKSNITFRCLGFDQHFNAFGTSALMLTNGKCGQEAPAFEDKKGISYKTWEQRNIPSGMMMDSVVNWWTGIDWTSFSTDFMNNEIYIGANDPALEFNAQQSRFEFSRLHTPEVVGTSASVNSSLEGNTPSGDETTVSYKLNKRLSRLNYSPNFIPYNNTLSGSDSASDEQSHVVLDRNIIPYTIMDATSGITFEDYGCDETNWNKSLWETLGFTYEQFHQTSATRLERFNNLPIKTSTPTTNALVQSSNLRLWYRQNGVPIYEPENIIVPTVIGGKFDWGERFVPNNTGGPGGVNFAITGLQDFSPVVQSCSSTSILATNLPRKMASPIYLVKTDLISPEYIGGPEGSSKLPVVAVVPKNSGYGDYYFGDNFTEFTITAPKTVVDITTSIIDADGKEARVDDASCVVYQITKAHQSNATVLEEILNPPKK